MIEKIKKEQEDLYHSSLNAEFNPSNSSIFKSRGNSMKQLIRNNFKAETTSERRKINTEMSENLSEKYDINEHDIEKPFLHSSNYRPKRSRAKKGMIMMDKHCFDKSNVSVSNSRVTYGRALDSLEELKRDVRR